MLVLFFMLSGACACSVAVVKSLNMGNRTDTHTHTHTHSLLHTRRCKCGVWSSIFSEARCLFGYLKVLSQSVFNIIHEGLLFLNGVAGSSTRLWNSLTFSYTHRNTHTHTHILTHASTNGKKNKTQKWMHMHWGDQPHLDKVTCLNRSLQFRPANKHIRAALLPDSSF